MKTKGTGVKTERNPSRILEAPSINFLYLLKLKSVISTLFKLNVTINATMNAAINATMNAAINATINATIIATILVLHDAIG